MLRSALPSDVRCDALDDFNHTRLRRARILEALLETQDPCVAYHPAPAASSLEFYEPTHSPELLTFLLTAHDAWKQLGPDGWDHAGSNTNEIDDNEVMSPPPLVPGNMPLARQAVRQRPSQHVLGQMGYYCNDACTPVFDQLKQELLDDAGVMQRAIELARDAYINNSGDSKKTTIYAVPTHPGHHAAADSFGGYCYVNHVAGMAKQLQLQLAENKNVDGSLVKVAILDVDYHCGNGTASIFEDDPSVLVVSLHCDPNFEYPFHIGFADDNDVNDSESNKSDAAAKTLHLPLPPKTTWPAYQVALERGLTRIVQDFSPVALFVSMGLDTYAKDPCALRRAGFELSGNDYVEMGHLIGTYSKAIPSVVFLQEGGVSYGCCAAGGS